ncbi:MAG: hypothetical protein KTR24_08600 [Saprospiraceae bacterium]|nr:hypothetical protein [Saprospiraceae bacterium]
MRIKLFFLLSALVCLFFGVSMIFAQEAMGDTYLVTPEEMTPGLRLTGLIYGVLLIGFGVGLLMVRRASMSYGRRAMLAATVVSDLLVAAVHIYAISAGWENAMGWSTVALVVVLGVWGCLLLMREKVD